MATKPKKTAAFKVGDLVRIRRSGGSLSEQRYQIEKLFDGSFACHISQWPSDGNPAHELFDTSMLVVDNAGPALLTSLFLKGTRI
jgi:hypothetical protein